MNRQRRKSRQRPDVRDLQVRLGLVGYDAVGPYITLEAPGEVLHVRPMGADANLVGYHLSLLGLGGADPVARVVALAAHLDTALQAAAAAPANQPMLLGAIASLHRRLAAYVATDVPLTRTRLTGPHAPAVQPGNRP